MAASNDTAQLNGVGDNPMLPIYKQLSLKNGQINKMSKQQLKKKLDELHQDNR